MVSFSIVLGLMESHKSYHTDAPPTYEETMAGIIPPPCDYTQQNRSNSISSETSSLRQRRRRDQVNIGIILVIVFVIIIMVEWARQVDQSIIN